MKRREKRRIAHIHSYRLWSEENCWSISRQNATLFETESNEYEKKEEEVKRKLTNIYHRRCSNKIQLTFCLSSERMHRWFFEKWNVKRELAHRSSWRWTINLFPSSTDTNRYIFSIKSDWMSRQKMIRRRTSSSSSFSRRLIVEIRVCWHLSF